MRIVMLGVGWSPESSGGLNRYFRGLHDALVRRGQDVVAVVHGPASSAPAGVAEVASSSDSLAQRLRNFAHPLAQARSADVVDAHFALYAAFPALVGYLRRKPLVVHFHGPWWAESEAAGGNRLAVAAKRAIERLYYRRAVRVVVLSDAFAAEVTSLGVALDRIRKVRPGVDLERFVPLEAAERDTARERFGITADQRVVLSVRRMVPRMGLDRLLRAWALRQPDSGDLLVLAGSGPAQPDLESLAASLGIASTVRFLGRVPEPDLPTWYAVADLAAVPTISLEGFGLVVLEALASGTPVLASDVGGLGEALQGLPPGHLLPDAEPETWAKALTDALDGVADLVDRAGARRHAETFTWDGTAESVERVYSEAVAAARAAG